MHHGGRWKVYSALLRTTRVSIPTVFRPKVRTSVEFSSFYPAMSPLVAVFDDV